MSNGSPRRPSLLGALALAILVMGLAVARPAAAQVTGVAGTTGTTGTGTTTGSLADGDIFIGVQQTEGANLSAFDLARFFNVSNCQCNTPVFFYFTLTSTGFAKRALVPSGNLLFFVGSSCNDPILQKTNCQLLKSEQIVTFMQNGRDTVMTTSQVVSANTTVATTSLDGGTTTLTSSAMPNTACTSPVNGFNQTIWAIFDYGADGTFDFSATQAVFVDLTPPPAPTNIRVAPANEALNVTWTAIDFSTNMDLQGYQVFCQRAGGLQVFPKNSFSSVVRTCTAVSGTGVVGLDPLFACSPLLNITANSFRVKILQNDIYYAAAVVAVDNSGNALPPVLIGRNPSLGADVIDPASSFQKPQRTLSFYDVYRDGNLTNSGGTGSMATPGAATGGFCAVAGHADDGRRGWTVGLGAGAAGFVALAAAVARARRRRR
jgi:hypothetical protein